MSDIIEVVKNRDPGEREFQQAVTEVMQRIRKNRDTISPKSTNYLDYDKSKVKKEGNFDVAF